MTLPSQSPPLSTASSHSKALTLVNSAKSSGRCIPSLLPNEAELNADTLFLSSVSNLVDYAGSHSKLVWHDVIYAIVQLCVFLHHLHLVTFETHYDSMLLYFFLFKFRRSKFNR